MIEHLNKFFMAIIILSILTYFERPDYNLPLFAFIMLLWDNAYVKQKLRMWYLMVISLLVDLIWIIYWAVTWNGYANREKGLCNFTIFLSCLIFVVKIVVIILTFVRVEDCKKGITKLPSNLKYVFKGPG